jgi:hypothetical protein
MNADRNERTTPLMIGSSVINRHKILVIVSFVFSVSFFIFPVEFDDISSSNSDYLGFTEESGFI